RTRAGAGIDDRCKGIRIEPLSAAGLRYAGNRGLAIQRDAGNPVCILRAAALKDTVIIRRVRCADYTEGQSTVQESRLLYLPIAEHLPQEYVAGVKRNLIN